jgi:beta-lactamase class A
MRKKLRSRPWLAACALTLSFSLCIGRAALGAEPAATAVTSLQNALNELAVRARPGTLGITVRDLQTGRSWHVNADRAYPMMSVFKAPLGATVLAERDEGKLSLDQAVIIGRGDLMTAGRSEIARTFRGDHETFSVRQLLAAAVSHSDNTAADVLLELVGGPGAVTAFLRAHGILHMRVDRSEEEIAQQFQQHGYAAYLQDPRDRTTADDAALFLQELWQRKLLSAPSTQTLLALLYAQVVPDRLRAGVPSSVRLADKCGTTYTMSGITAAFNDIGILSWPDGHTVIVAAFLMGSDASPARMNALYRDIARAVVSDLQVRPAT